MDESWNLAQAAQFLRIHPDTLAQRARTGDIPGTKIGRAWVFLPEHLKQENKPKNPNISLRDLRRAAEKLSAYGSGCEWTDRRGRHGKAVRQATPPWASDEKIRAIYQRARNLTKSTGIAHHVDHIIPLRNDFVCGLHVEANLMPIPASVNIAKRNRWMPES
jgi:hypothetical protein